MGMSAHRSPTGPVRMTVWDIPAQRPAYQSQLEYSDPTMLLQSCYKVAQFLLLRKQNRHFGSTSSFSAW